MPKRLAKLIPSFHSCTQSPMMYPDPWHGLIGLHRYRQSQANSKAYKAPTLRINPIQPISFLSDQVNRTRIFGFQTSSQQSGRRYKSVRMTLRHMRFQRNRSVQTLTNTALRSTKCKGFPSHPPDE